MKINTVNDSAENVSNDGILLGCFINCIRMPTGLVKLDLKQKLKDSGFTGKKGEKKLFYGINGHKRVAVIGVGGQEKFNHKIARRMTALGVRLLRSDGAKNIVIESIGDAQATAEGAILGLQKMNELKTEKKQDFESVTFSGSEEEIIKWEKGVVIAESQNIARRLGELPSNLATPTFFVNEARKEFEGIKNIKIKDYDEEWAKEMNMGAFLSVAKGSREPPKFLVIEYNGSQASEKPICYVGKGITFDTGGISLKPSANMGSMRGDCTGAAVVIGALLAIAKLKIKANIVIIAPLTENMPGGDATKPSDVVFASNGKSIEVANTDAEGRMILSDGLVYAEKNYEPSCVIDVATLTGAVNVALGEFYTGTFTRSDKLWNMLKEAGELTDEPFWRLPMNKKYFKQLKSSLADMKNVGGSPGGASLGAMFLSEFIETENWAHLDIAGVTWPKFPAPFQTKSNTGMPVRALVKFAELASKK